MTPADLDLNNDKWRLQYQHIINNRKPLISSFDSNAYNYKYDTMGIESTYNAYRSAIIYLQLSPHINTEIIKIVFKTTKAHLTFGLGKQSPFHVLFLNDEKGNLMHTGKPINDWRLAAKTAEKYLHDFSSANYIYSNKMSQIFPRIDFYAREVYPSRNDLCVLITDQRGVIVDEQIKNKILNKCNKFVKIVADNNTNIEVIRIRTLEQFTV